MTPGDPVTWPGGAAPRVGVLVARVEPNAEPALPAGVGRTRRRYREGLSMATRALCREASTGYYFAPRWESVSPAPVIQ